jgi:hypothetical protein
MSDQLITGVISIAMAIIGLAIIATIFSPKAKTTDVVRSAGGAFSNSILAAVSPVTGNAPLMSMG